MIVQGPRVHCGPHNRLCMVYLGGETHTVPKVRHTEDGSECDALAFAREVVIDGERYLAAEVMARPYVGKHRRDG